VPSSSCRRSSLSATDIPTAAAHAVPIATCSSAPDRSAVHSTVEPDRSSASVFARALVQVLSTDAAQSACSTGAAHVHSPSCSAMLTQPASTRCTSTSSDGDISSTSDASSADDANDASSASNPGDARVASSESPVNCLSLKSTDSSIGHATFDSAALDLASSIYSSHCVAERRTGTIHPPPKEGDSSSPAPQSRRTLRPRQLRARAHDSPADIPAAPPSSAASQRAASAHNASSTLAASTKSERIATGTPTTTAATKISKRARSQPVKTGRQMKSAIRCKRRTTCTNSVPAPVLADADGDGADGADASDDSDGNDDDNDDDDENDDDDDDDNDDNDVDRRNHRRRPALDVAVEAESLCSLLLSKYHEHKDSVSATTPFAVDALSPAAASLTMPVHDCVSASGSSLEQLVSLAREVQQAIHPGTSTDFDANKIKPSAARVSRFIQQRSMDKRLAIYLLSALAFHLKAKVPRGEYTSKASELLGVNSRTNRAAYPRLYELIQVFCPLAPALSAGMTVTTATTMATTSTASADARGVAHLVSASDVERWMHAPLFVAWLGWTQWRSLLTARRCEVNKIGVRRFLATIFDPDRDWMAQGVLQVFRDPVRSQWCVRALIDIPCRPRGRSGLAASATVRSDDEGDAASAAGDAASAAGDASGAASSIHPSVHTEWARLIGHMPSKRCNVKVDATGQLVATRAIAAGDVLSRDYGLENCVMQATGVSFGEWMDDAEMACLKERMRMFEAMHENVCDYVELAGILQPSSSPTRETSMGTHREGVMERLYHHLRKHFAFQA
jgi:hypothetical protein